MGDMVQRIAEAVDRAIKRCPSPEAAATALGISKTRLYNLRTGSVADPGISVVARVAAFLGESIDEICGSDYHTKLDNLENEYKKKLERSEWIIDQMRNERLQGTLPREGFVEPAAPVNQGHGEDYLARADLAETTEQVLTKIAGTYDLLRGDMEQGPND